MPYFKAGLENNEFCIGVTSKPLVKEEAEKSLRKALPHFDHYREKGQIEIVTHTDWYLKDDTFDFRRVLDAWIDKLNQALTKGYDGMRITGNTAWLEKKDWRSFTDYEEEVNRVIGKYRIIAICSYSIDRCSAPDVIDVVSNHGFVLIRKEGAWKIIEDSEHTRLKKILYSTTEHYRSFVQNFHGIAFYRHSDFTPIFMHGALEEITGYTEEMFISGNLRWDKIIHPEDLIRLSELFEKMRSIPKHSDVYEYRIIRKDGQMRWIQEYCQNLCDDSGKPIIVRGAIYDITARKQAEEALRESDEFNFALFQHNPIETIVTDLEGRVVNYNIAKKKSGDRIPNIGDVMYRDYAGKHEIDMYTELIECIRMSNLKEFPELKYGDRFLLIKIAPFSMGAIITSQDITEQKEAEKSLQASESELKKQKLALEQKTIALREVIGQIEEEKNKIKDDITTNVNEVLFPILERLKLNDPSNKYIDLLKHHLEKLSSSFSQKITKKSYKLTKREIEICTMVESGLTNKEISKLLGVSCYTVEKHRNNIRIKLDITNKNINLSSFLQQL